MLSEGKYLEPKTYSLVKIDLRRIVVSYRLSKQSNLIKKISR